MSSLSLSELTIPSMRSACHSLLAILRKAMTHAEEHKIGEDVLLSARLYPNMFSLSRQVQMVADVCRRGIDRLEGKEPSSVEDKEKTFLELVARLESTLTRIEEADRNLIDGCMDTLVEVKMGTGRTLQMSARKYAHGFVLPNLIFHVTTAYNILRHNGVPLGKRDYLTSFLELPDQETT